MTLNEYKNIAWTDDAPDRFSFRALLSKKFNLLNLNFSEGGSSNQRQFRFARELFSEPSMNKLLEIYNKVIVMWGITSTARTELWDVETDTYKNYMFSGGAADVKADGKPEKYTLSGSLSNFGKSLLKYTYDHDAEVRSLYGYVNLWNGFFSTLNIQNIWFDTFNTHLYPRPIDNKIEGDLLSTMSLSTNRELGTYHLSNWRDDDPRITRLVKSHILNPISFHPTKLGHQKIAEILEPHIKQLTIR